MYIKEIYLFSFVKLQMLYLYTRFSYICVTIALPVFCLGELRFFFCNLLLHYVWCELQVIFTHGCPHSPKSCGAHHFLSLWEVIFMNRPREKSGLEKRKRKKKLSIAQITAKYLSFGRGDIKNIRDDMCSWQLVPLKRQYTS